MTALLRLWGKTDKKSPERYHPLLFHMLDVANVTRLLWQERLGEVTRRHIAASLGLPEDQAEVAVTLLAGLHDLGKAAPAFQKKSPFLADQLKRFLLLLGPHPSDDPHGFITSKDLPRIFSNGAFGWTAPKAVANVLAAITGAHHGTFPRSIDLSRMARNTLGDAGWTEARDDIARVLAQTLFSTATPPAFETSEFGDPGAVPILSGLVSVADWIGSSQHFQICDITDLEEYATLSRQRARAALIDFGWLPAVRPASPLPFALIFPFPPNLLQSAMERVVRGRRGSSLIIVEGPMGEGKTEAGLYAADYTLCTQESCGFYMALPTQATSNAMFKRVKTDYLERRGHEGPLNLQLVHGNALLSEDYQKLQRAVIYDGTGNDGRVIAQTWFTARKRPLLAPFGVGTIDQSLLSVLQTRHWFVRLFGLANKTVIFDEVHAYDAYMSRLLDRLLAWLAQVDCSVVLLSATLPSGRRKALVDAYRAGASEDLPQSDYPRITWVDGVTVGVEAVEKAADRKVRLHFAGEGLQELAEMIKAALADGGYAAIICNTVARAQQAHQELDQQLRDTECLLFHARMPFGWRREREERVLEKFGKNGPRHGRAVLVATQVVEQSLDLDFDWMASDMAPVDLLLQRIGRLHRHPNRDRPALLQEACLVVLCNGLQNGPPPDFGMSRFVYQLYVLLRSWLVIREKTMIQLPDEIETLVEKVYTASVLSVPDAVWETALHRASEAMQKQREKDERQAEGRAVSAPDLPKRLIEQFSQELEEDDDPAVHKSLQAATRSGDPSVQVVCLLQEEGRLVLPDGTHMNVTLQSEYDLPMTRRLMDASLSLSHSELFSLLCAEDGPYRPPAWRDNPHFRHHRLLRFRSDRKVVVGRYTLLLDPVLGLVIENEEHVRDA